MVVFKIKGGGHLGIGANGKAGLSCFCQRNPGLHSLKQNYFQSGLSALNLSALGKAWLTTWMSSWIMRLTKCCSWSFMDWEAFKIMEKIIFVVGRIVRKQHFKTLDETGLWWLWDFSFIEGHSLLVLFCLRNLYFILWQIFVSCICLASWLGQSYLKYRISTSVIFFFLK